MIDWVQLGVQTLMIIAGLIALYWKQRVEAEHRFTKLEQALKHQGDDHVEIKKEITNIHGRVGGISREVAELKGKVNAS